MIDSRIGSITSSIRQHWSWFICTSGHGAMPKGKSKESSATVCRCACRLASYPWMTLLRQGLGSIVLGIEAIWRLPPDIFLGTRQRPWLFGVRGWVLHGSRLFLAGRSDTTGYSFTYPIV